MLPDVRCRSLGRRERVAGVAGPAPIRSRDVVERSRPEGGVAARMVLSEYVDLLAVHGDRGAGGADAPDDVAVRRGYEVFDDEGDGLADAWRVDQAHDDVVDFKEALLEDVRSEFHDDG